MSQAATILQYVERVGKGPGKFYRQGISLVQLFEMFPDDETAEAWFRRIRWPVEGSWIRGDRDRSAEHLPDAVGEPACFAAVG